MTRDKEHRTRSTTRQGNLARQEPRAAHGLQRKKNPSQGIFALTLHTKQPATNCYALRIRSEGEDDLILFKFYKPIPDKLAEHHEFIRIVDESGEDYLYHNSRFMMIAVPKEVARVLDGNKR